MKALILTYHSHHILGDDYSVNDHIALPSDLNALTRAGYKILALGALIEEVQQEGLMARLFSRKSKIAAITFDDGPEYDAVDFLHPTLGPQHSFLRAMEEFRDSALGRNQQEMVGTSFVIASPEARLIMETSFDPMYTFLQPGTMNDRWWLPAIDSDLIEIANHSWDHLHPALPIVAHSRQAKADFTQVDSELDADAQIHAASGFIAARTNGRNAPYFAYPFGHFNRYLIDEYLPANNTRNNLRAAVSTGARPVTRNDSVWCVPRYTCGHHWKSPPEFDALLSSL